MTLSPPQHREKVTLLWRQGLVHIPLCFIETLERFGKNTEDIQRDSRDLEGGLSYNRDMVSRSPSIMSPTPFCHVQPFQSQAFIVHIIFDLQLFISLRLQIDIFHIVTSFHFIPRYYIQTFFCPLLQSVDPTFSLVALSHFTRRLLTPFGILAGLYVLYIVISLRMYIPPSPQRFPLLPHYIVDLETTPSVLHMVFILQTPPFPHLHVLLISHPCPTRPTIFCCSQPPPLFHSLSCIFAQPIQIFFLSDVYDYEKAK